MKLISYYFFRVSVWIFKFIPFRLMYILSDILAFILHRILRYRLKVIKANLAIAKNYLNYTKENSIIRDIYRNLSDISMEGIKGFSMKPEQIKKRHKITNPEILEPLIPKNQSFILVAGHYNNWEWGAFSPNFYVQHKTIALYKPLTNNYIEKFVRKQRSVYGSVLADINYTSDFFAKYAGALSMFLMASDQSPTKPELALWFQFLGAPTPCLHGLEKYIQKYDQPVVFVDIQRVKRGYYENTMSWIRKPEDPYIYGQSTHAFFKVLEKIIKENPSSWLWSHRRWKHQNRFPGQYTIED